MLLPPLLLSSDACVRLPQAQASVNLATETALVRVMVPKGKDGKADAAAVAALGERLAQVRQHAVGDSWGNVGFTCDFVKQNVVSHEDM
jgi:hypothetical protein